MPASCGEAPADVNGVWTYTGTKHNDTANINCNDGTELDTNTDAYLVCSEDGIWVGTVGCVPVDCGEFPTPANGEVSYTNGTTYLSVIQISCDAGYTLFNDEDTAVCKDTGFWRGDPGCTNVGTITVGSVCYSFYEGETVQITCDIAVVGWGTTVIFAVSDDGQINPIVLITQTDNVFTNTSSLTYVTLNPSSVLATDSASLVVDFTPISATDAGQYMCGAVVGSFESAGQNNSNLRDFSIFIQDVPMLVIDNTTIQNNTQAVVQCTFESDNLQSVQIQIKYKNADTFEDISDQQTPVENQTPCTTVYTVSATFIATDAHHEVEVKCVAILTDTTELTSFAETLTLAISAPANCTSDENAYYEHPFDCYKYLLCTGGRLYVNGCVDTSNCPAINTVDNSFAGCSTSKCEECSSGK